jgi:hypothetical protein
MRLGVRVRDHRNLVAGLGVVMAVAVLVAVPETLPPDQRHGGGLRTFAHAGREVLRNRRYVGYLVVAGSAMGALFAYVATSAFVLAQSSRSDPRMGMAVYQAVYDGTPTTPEQRAAALRGVVFVSLDIERAFRLTLEQVPAPLGVCVIDTEPSAGAQARIVPDYTLPATPPAEPAAAPAPEPLAVP